LAAKEWPNTTTATPGDPQQDSKLRSALWRSPLCMMLRDEERVFLVGQRRPDLLDDRPVCRSSTGCIW
jgi:hypothetical protein